MVSLVGFDPWLAQPVVPQWPFRLNRGSPQAEGLVAWWPLWVHGSYAMDLRNGIMASPSAGLTAAASYPLWPTFSSGEPYIATTWSEIGGSANRTITAVIANSPNGYIFGYGTPAAAGNAFRVRLEASKLRWEGHNMYKRSDTAVGATVSRMAVRLAGTTGNDIDLFLDGNLLGIEASTNLATTINTQTGALHIARREAASPVNAYSGVIADLRVYDRALSNAELLAYHNDPANWWELYETPRTFVAVPTAAPAPAGGVPSGLGLLGVGV